MSQTTTSKNPIDLFITGARQGWNIAVTSVLPNVIMAFAVIEVLKITGILTLVGTIASPVMTLWDLPGEALIVFATGLLASGGAVGMMISLYSSEILTVEQLFVMTPGVMLIGGMLQYVGRCLGTSEANRRYWGWHILFCFVNACIAMWIMRVIVFFFY